METDRRRLKASSAEIGTGCRTRLGDRGGSVRHSTSTEIYLRTFARVLRDKAMFAPHLDGDNSECAKGQDQPRETATRTAPSRSNAASGQVVTPGGVYQYKRRVLGRRGSVFGGM